MVFCRLSIFHTLFISFTLLLPIHSEFYEAGPVNITRKEGEENVNIDCPFSSSTSPIWRINDSLYGSGSLPVPFYQTAFGMYVKFVDKTLNQTKFQCLAPSGKGSQILASESGVLSVKEKRNYSPPSALAQIFLDHQHFKLNGTHKTIAWRRPETDICCTSPVITYAINATTCDLCDSCQVIIGTTTDLEFPIPVVLPGFVDRPVFFKVIAKCIRECAQTGYFQILSDVMSGSTTVNVIPGSQSCVDVSQLSGILQNPQAAVYAIWPGDNVSDCICPLCNDTTTSCLLNNCHCYNTSFAPKFVLESSTSNIPNTNRSLCWPSLFPDHNDTDIFFGVQERVCSDVLNERGPLNVMIYVDTARLLARGPPQPPTLSLNHSSSTPAVCFNTYSFYPVISYEINITDATGDGLLSGNMLNESKGCILFQDSLYPHQCSPFVVSVRAYNKVGPSNVSTINFRDDSLRYGDGSYCTCLTEKVNIDVTNIQVTTTTVEMKLVCTKVIVSSQINIVKVEIMDEDKEVDQDSLLCNSQPFTLQYSNLQQNSHYGIYFNMPTQINSENEMPSCIVSQFMTQLDLPPPPKIDSYQTPQQLEICFTVDSSYSVDLYEVDITDITRDRLYTQDLKGSEKCAYLTRDLYPPECLPFSVSARAINNAGASEWSDSDFGSGGNFCSCMKRKVALSFDVTKTTISSATILSRCTKFLSTSKITSVGVVVGLEQREISCDGRAYINTYTSLLAGKLYDISYVLLHQYDSRVCRANTFKTQSDSPSQTQAVPYLFGFICFVTVLLVH